MNQTEHVQQQNHHHNQNISDCVRDGTLSYIYLLEDSLLNDASFQYQHEPVPINYENLKQLSIKSPETLKNILASPFTINPSSTDISINKEVFDYTRFFEVKDATIFHDNNSIKRYARFHLNLTLKFMGCKSIHARHITTAVFEQLEKCRVHAYANQLQFKRNTPPTSTSTVVHLNHNTGNSDTIYCVGMLRSTFFYIVGYVISTYQYSKPQYLSEFPVACDVQEKKHSFTILLGGTSGCGKSTLTALLASRVGFAAVISTDNIRQILRKFISRTESPILWASTYHAGEIISDPSLSHKEKILQGYEAQNEMIFNKLDVLIDHYERRNESLIVEGVHLDTRLIVRLVKKHPSCIPFLMYISNEAKHKERFAIRSKYMTLDPHQNKYTKYFKNIRIINDYLCQGADKILIPQIDNTSIDRSLATIHSTIFACLKRKINNGESYYNSETGQLNMLHQEYEQIQHQFWSSKGMLRLIQKKRYSVGYNQQTNSVEPEETFNSDDDDEEPEQKKLNERNNKLKSHSREKNMSNTSTITSDSESDSESREDRVDYFIEGSLGS